MSNFLVQTSVSELKRALKATVTHVEAPAIDYIDWVEFEKEAEQLLQTNMPTRHHLKTLVATHCTRARQKYQRAVASGVRFAGQRPN